MKALLLKNSKTDEVLVEFIESGVSNKKFFLMMNTENDEHSFDYEEVVAIRDYLDKVLDNR